MGFIPANESDVSSAIDEIILENIPLINARGEGSIGPLMGKVMGKLGGAADGKVVSRVLREKITSVLQRE